MRSCGTFKFTKSWTKMQKMFSMFSKMVNIDCMVFNAIFNNISVILRQPVHLSMLPGAFLTSTLHNIFSSHWLLSHLTIVETMDSGRMYKNYRSCVCVCFFFFFLNIKFSIFIFYLYPGKVPYPIGKFHQICQRLYTVGFLVIFY